MKRRALLGAIGASMIGMAGCLGANEYTLSALDIEQADGPLRIDASLTDRDIAIDSPTTTLMLTLENTGEEPLDLRAPNLWPFGVPALTTVDAEYTRQILLMSDKYEEIDSVEVESDRSGIGHIRGFRNDPITQTLEARQSVSREYTLQGEELSDGTYELQGYRPLHIGRPRPQGNETDRNRSQSGNDTRQMPPERDEPKPLLEYGSPDDDEFQTYLPTVSVTASTKSLIPGL